MRGLLGFGTTLPVLGFLHSVERARDHSPLLPLVDRVARRERSNGKLKPTTSSPFLTAFQKTRPINDERVMRFRLNGAGKSSIDGSVFGFSRYRCSSFA